MPPVPRSLAQLQGQHVPYEYLRSVQVFSRHTVLVASPTIRDTGVAMNAHTNPKMHHFHSMWKKSVASRACIV